MAEAAVRIRFLDFVRAFLEEMDLQEPDKFPEPFRTIFLAVVRVYKGLRGLVDASPGVSTLEDINYVFPVNAAQAACARDLPKYGKNIVQALRTDKAKYWEDAAREYKETVGAAESVSQQFHLVKSDLTCLQKWSEQNLETVTATDSEKVCPTLDRCCTKLAEWQPVLRDGACDVQLALLRKIINNVMGALVETEVHIKLKVLCSFQAAAKVLADPDLQQNICDIQLNLENADQSNRVRAIVEGLKVEKPPADLNVKLRDLAQVVVGKPKLDDSAAALLADPSLGDNAFKLAAKTMGAGTVEDVETLKLTSRLLSSLQKPSPEIQQIAKLLGAGVGVLDARALLSSSAEAGHMDMKKVVGEMNVAMREFKATEGSLIQLAATNKLGTLKDSMQAFIDGPLKSVFAEAVAAMHPKVVDVLQAILDDCASKLSAFKKVCRCGKDGEHWGAADDPSKPIFESRRAGVAPCAAATAPGHVGWLQAGSASVNLCCCAI